MSIDTEQVLDYCPKCGSELEENDPWTECPKCGIVNIQFWVSDWEREQ